MTLFKDIWNVEYLSGLPPLKIPIEITLSPYLRGFEKLRNSEVKYE